MSEISLNPDYKRNKCKSNIKITDKICESIVFIFTLLSALIIFFLFIFIIGKSKTVLSVSGFGFLFNTGFDSQITDAFNAPADKPVWQFGAFGLLAGTLYTTLGALIIALPFGLGCAVVITEYAPSWLKNILISFVRLLASIPSVIFGLIGISVVVPFVQNYLISNEMQVKYISKFQLTGNGLFAGIIVLSIMILPIITALSVDAIKAVPSKYREAAYALGFTHWRSITKVVIPTAKSGIIAGVMLAIGRAVGEALALSMVCGGVGNVPDLSNGIVALFTPVLTLASAIINKSEAMAVLQIEEALFACGALLLVTCTLLSIATKLVEYLIIKRGGQVD